MSPGYLTGALGINYKPNKSLSLFLAAVSYRGTFVLDDALNAVGAYGVETNSRLRNELGGLFMAKYQKDVMKNVNLKTQLTLFSNYIESPQNIDVLWDVLISMKINKYISASISTTLIYDHDILLPLIATDDSGNEISFSGRRAQFKEVLNIGFSYKF
jgi:3-oxoacyl-ACP reductase-like protein